MQNNRLNQNCKCNENLGTMQRFSPCHGTIILGNWSGRWFESKKRGEKAIQLVNTLADIGKVLEFQSIKEHTFIYSLDTL